MDERTARRALAGFGVVGLAIGAALALAPGPVLRAGGMPAGGPALLGLRLFAVRELVLGWSLLRAAGHRDPRAARVVIDAVAAAQAGDVATAAAMRLRGSISWRVALGILGSAPPTLLALLAVRAALR